MLYKVVKFICWLLFHTIFRVKLKGLENVPKDGAFILCGNHISMWDPVMLVGLCPRRVYFMGKKELYNHPIMGLVFKLGIAYPVDRENPDMEAFRKTIKFLNDGQVVGIFAQGKRVKEGETKAAKAGVALFATKTNCAVVPVGIVGNYKLFSRPQVTIGEAITFDEFKGKKLNSEQLGEIAEGIMNKVSLLRDKED